MPADAKPGGASGGASQRLDKWLWFARVIRTRTLAAGLISDGRVRVNRERVLKPSQTVRPGDVITVAVGAHVRVLEVVAGGTRRGPPTEAQALFRELTAAKPAVAEPAPGTDDASGQREAGSGRPTKRDRRQIDRLRDTEV
ncbi:MAG: RNA-binding S4 domain-containing protein [Hyphomicrobiaceae bacterium]